MMAVGRMWPAGPDAARWLKAVWLMVASVVVLALVSQPGYAAKSFATQPFDYYITDYVSELQRLAKTVDKTLPELDAEVAAAEAAGNPRQTAVAIEKRLSKSPAEAQLWLSLGRQLVIAEPFNDQDSYQLPTKVIGAGLKAYLLAVAAPDEAEALAIAAQGFGKR